MRLFFGSGASQYIPTELDALPNKQAQPVATSLLRVLLPVARRVSEGFTSAAEPPGPVALSASQPWLAHVIDGDGIAESEAATKLALAYMKANRQGRLRYFLMAVKCALHQANLSAGSAVSGRAAACGARNTAALGARRDGMQEAARADSERAAHRQLCATTTRLFKFMISDYYAEFCASLASLTDRLAVVAGEGDPGARCKWERLSALYGPGVFPEGLLEVLNGGLGRWEHRVLGAGDLPTQTDYAAACARSCSGGCWSWTSTRR